MEGDIVYYVNRLCNLSVKRNQDGGQIIDDACENIFVEKYISLLVHSKEIIPNLKLHTKIEYQAIVSISEISEHKTITGYTENANLI